MKRWWLSVVVALAAVVEVFVRDDLPNRGAAIAFTVCIALALGFRRSHPLAATAFAFSLATVATVVRHQLALPELAPASSVAILLLPYALCRWATRRHIVIGAVFIAITWCSSLVAGEMEKAEDLVGSAVVLILPGTIGALVRSRDEAHSRAVDQARLLEREQLARELHDSVAHHLTAITLQAQAARAVLATRPDDASNALRAIEDESKRTLVELRAIVGALRDDVAPAAGVRELRELARANVEVELVGNFDALNPVLERALFRLAQETVTNFTRHARNASKLQLRVTTATDDVQFSAQDDGDLATRGTGFGLVGMAERVALLGGKFEAGPLAERGWRVTAVLPR